MYRAPNGQHCFLVAIEGPDRVGKATQAEMLQQGLYQEGLKATIEEIPSDDKVTYPQIYAMLHSGAVDRYPVVFQTLQATNRRYFQVHFLPNLAHHFDVVILDRWNLSTRVYGRVSGVKEDTTEAILDGILEPDLNIVLDGDPFPKEGLDTWEANLVFQSRVRELYGQYCDQDPKQFVKIEANRPPHDVRQDVLAEVLKRLR